MNVPQRYKEVKIMEKKERLKPLSLYGYDLKEAIRAILSVNPRKIREEREKPEPQRKPRETKRKEK